jgi:hypothetical protein
MLENLQYSSNAFLNWFLSKNSKELVQKPYYEIDMMCNFLKNSISTYQNGITNKEYKSKKINIKNYSLGNSVIKSISNIAKQNNQNANYLLHGSFASNDYVLGWSDIDIFCIVNKDNLNYKSYKSLVKADRDINSLFQSIDKHQHHGIQYVTNADMLCYNQMFLPVEVLKNSYSLSGNLKQEIKYRNNINDQNQRLISLLNLFKTSKETGVFSHHKYNGEYLREEFKNSENAMYQLKYFLSVIAAIPCYYYNSKNIFLDKPTAIKKIQSKIDDRILKKTTLIRNKWDPKLQEKNKIPIWVQKELGVNYLNDGYNFIKKVVSLLDE